MLKKTLLLALLAVLFVPPAQAQQTISPSDADYLSEMPLDQFPGADAKNPGMQDIDGDGIADNVADMIPTGTGNGTATEEKKQVQYVYKPTGDTSLRRTIQDPRVDDGYVQSLMQQHAPRN